MSYHLYNYIVNALILFHIYYKEINHCFLFISVSDEGSQSKTVDEQTQQPGTHNTSHSNVGSLKI